MDQKTHSCHLIVIWSKTTHTHANMLEKDAQRYTLREHAWFLSVWCVSCCIELQRKVTKFVGPTASHMCRIRSNSSIKKNYVHLSRIGRTRTPTADFWPTFFNYIHIQFFQCFPIFQIFRIFFEFFTFCEFFQKFYEFSRSVSNFCKFWPIVLLFLSFVLNIYFRCEIRKNDVIFEANRI